MKRRPLLVTITALVIIVGALGTIKVIQFRRMAAHSNAFSPPPATVTVAQVQPARWESRLTAVGSLEAVQGVMIGAELSGRITRIAFASDSSAKKGDLLVQQDISTESAQLNAALSDLALTRKNFERAAQLIKDKVIAKSAYDDSKAAYDKAMAQVGNIRSVIEKKTVRAPFAGRLGIRGVNLGQTLEVGDPIVSLQALDPIHVNFLLPQQQMVKLSKGLAIQVSADGLAGRNVQGQITAINSEVESDSRNIRVQATLENPDERLRPGMFVNVEVVLPEENDVLAIPATAVLNAPYSDTVFVVEKEEPGKEGTDKLKVRQQVVKLGEKRGDFVTVQSGLKAGQSVVSTGVFKLRNGQSVVVDNSLSPEFKIAPNPDNA